MSGLGRRRYLLAGQRLSFAGRKLDRMDGSARRLVCLSKDAGMQGWSTFVGGVWVRTSLGQGRVRTMQEEGRGSVNTSEDVGGQGRLDQLEA